ncbi:MAG: GGDEF domain-containing protein [Chakrabartia sp.]
MADEHILPLAADLGLISAQSLAALATRLDDQIHALEALMDRVSEDARDYAVSLEKAAGRLASSAPPDPAFADLIRLARDTADKTRQLQAQLHNRGAEIALIQSGLVEVSVAAHACAKGLPERREFERALGSAVERAKLAGTPLCVALCDIDGFAAVNQAHGLETGDRVIGFAGTLIEQVIDKEGFVCRGMGAEFLILFDGKSTRAARDITEKARESLSARNIVDRESGRRIGHLNFSAGIAALDGEYNISQMLGRADRALQRAKSTARGTVKIGY